ncbi:DUF4097 family beta strand repeat-containing protein [Paenibacillus glacialis]|uniref:DUF4097 domain-containing protein n=1 Tax=Paenibacillus glacialis TaxID=494026 RepID=A0A168K2P7_9BACL|nr:DUF4097 family beta strand repeat-containing protein [Paenibacillus glacialis]OAB41446.1 hypothetical protein PGLA_16740 [Paenibacillus glacialis]
MNNKVFRLGIFGFILIVIGIIGMSSNQFNFGDKLTEYNKKWTIDNDTLSHLIVTSEYTTDVEFVQSTDGTQSIELNGLFEDALISKLNQITPKNGQFEITMEDDVVQFFSISFKSQKATLIVSLPDLNQLQEVGLHFTSSDGSVTNLSANNIEITSRSGNLNLESIFAKQLRIEANSGNITGTDIQSNLQASVQSGNMNISNYAGEGTFKANSGNIELIQKGASSLDISAKSGNVTLTADPNFKGFFDVNANYGNIHSPESLRLTKDLIKVRTNSGDINITQNN